MAKKVALVLASGGARGMAHIGAIEELESRGYQISSIAGCSIGSLIGGIYAAGKISEARDWFCSLDKRDILSLTDFSFGLSHLVKGDRVLQAIQEWVPDRNIEDLPIPCAFVATDFIHSEEVVFRSGSLFTAIRASISIPMCFEPLEYNDTLLVDGGLVNPLPLNQIARTEGDILAAVNISGRSEIEPAWLLPSSPAVFEKMGRLGSQAEKLWNKLADDLEETKLTRNINYLNMVNRTFDLQLQANCRTMIAMTKPDILAEMPQDAYTTFDFDKAAEIMDRGRELMAQQLDIYEHSISDQ